MPSRVELIVDELIHKSRKEAAIAEGAGNMIKFVSIFCYKDRSEYICKGVFVM